MTTFFAKSIATLQKLLHSDNHNLDIKTKKALNQRLKMTNNCFLRKISSPLICVF